MERVTGLEPATVCLEGRHSSQLSYTRKLHLHELSITIFSLISSFFGGPSWTWTSDQKIMSLLL